nr:M56 family metallopeptidase [Gemmatimonadota bacterium]NIQ55950.1 M56 family metallopeptidase [Gemmatimonadota bacterium]NIX45687.1 hypothetical protein [Gemmatimonadota bacterium]NIY09994.1 hypothetical protein [Gemmatimonadota bacterium]
MLAVAAWAAMTAVLLVLLGVLSALLRLRRRRWRGCSVDGVDVLVSRDTGPAAFGLWRGRVVVPEWALALERGQRQLLVLHEAEHVRAGDPRVAFTALLMCCLVPWNLPLWLQLRRLRLALELDCDARVLRRAGDARGYGSLLLKVGQRRAGLALALAEPRSMLERRIRMITGTRSKGTVRAAALAGAAGLVLAMACEAPGPTDSAAERTSPDPVAPRLSNADGPCEPVVYRNATPSELAELDEANIENIHVLKPGVDGDAGEACGAIVVRTKDASPEDEAATRRLLERLGVPSLRPGQAGIRPEAQGDRQ